VNQNIKNIIILGLIGFLLIIVFFEAFNIERLNKLVGLTPLKAVFIQMDDVKRKCDEYSMLDKNYIPIGLNISRNQVEIWQTLGTLNLFPKGEANISSFWVYPSDFKDSVEVSYFITNSSGKFYETYYLDCMEWGLQQSIK